MADPAPPAFTPMSPPAPMMAPAPTARPGLVTAAGIIGVVYGCLIALGGILLAAFGSAISAVAGNFLPAGLGAVGVGLFVVIGLFVAIIGVLWALLGMQVLKGKNWARITTIVFAALGVLGGLGNLAKGGNLIGLAVDVFIIVALVLPQSTAWFNAMSGRPAA